MTSNRIGKRRQTSSPMAMAGCAVALTVAAAAGATEWIVDGADPAANDANPGTREAPLKTVSAAAQRVQPGDTVVVRPGVYRETVTLTVSGREGAPIVFRSEIPRRAVLCGSDPIADWRDEGGGVWSFAADDLKRIPDYDKDPAVFGNGEWVYADGSPLDRVRTADEMRPGTFRQDFEARRVFVCPPHGVDLGGVTVEYARRMGLFVALEPLDDIHLIGFTLIHNADWFRGRPAVRVSGQRWLVENNRVAWSSYSGLIMDRSHRAIVRNNLIEWCGNSGIGGPHNADMLIEGNTIRYNNWRRFNPNFEGGGSKWGFSFDARLRGNEVHGNHGAGLWFDAANTRILFEQNRVRDNSLWGLFSEMNWDVVFRDNVAYNNGIGICVAETVGAVVYRNVVFNNDEGIQVRGSYRRGTDREGAMLPQWRDGIRSIPGVAPLSADFWEAGYLLYWMAPRAFLSNNSVFRENIVFDNRWYNYNEHRPYGKPYADAPFVNNFSDHNIWFGPRAVAAFQSADGGYDGGLAGWQRASGRDEHSIEADPRAADTPLPDWARANRAHWNLGMRLRTDLAALRPGLVDSPMACEAQARLLRSSFLEPWKTQDPAIKAFLFEVDGERTLGLWTTHPMERRTIRIRPGVGRVTVEDGYLQRETRELVRGALTLPVSHVPVYVRSVGERVEEADLHRLSAPMFNRSGEPVPLVARFVNEGDAPLRIAARVTAGAGYRPDPDEIALDIEPGRQAEAEVRLRPEGQPRRGLVRVHVTGQAGDEPFTLETSFGVGESAGTVPRPPASIAVDGRLGDWGTLVSEGVPLGEIVTAEQFANGDLKAWSGPDDLGGRVYAAWTPEALYVAVEVTDDSVLPTPPGADPWSFDSVEIFVDGRSYDMQWDPAPTEGCYQIGISPAVGEHPMTVRMFQRFAKGVEAATTPRERGYIVELRIPLTRENFPAGDWKPGRPVKLSVLINDKDDPARADREYCFGWAFSPGGANFADTSGWRMLRLGEDAP